jgi:uncharacterized membrane protein
MLIMLFLEVFALTLIAVGVFLMSVPFGLICSGLMVLMLVFAAERGERKKKN